MEPVFIFLLLFAINLAVLTLNAVWYVLLIRKEKVVDQSLNRVEKEMDEALANSRRRAVEIIDAAQTKAAETLRETSMHQKNFEKLWGELLNEVKNRHMMKVDGSLHIFEEGVAELIVLIQKQLKESLGGNMVEVIGKTETALNSYVEMLGRHTEDLQGVVDKRLHDALATVDNDVQKYRALQMQKVDVEIRNVIGEVTREVLTEGLSSTDQEQLVIGALERAAEKGLLKLNV